MLTTDEVMLAGGTNSNNKTYYLYINDDYWLSSPAFFSADWGSAFAVNSAGSLDDLSMGDSTNCVRPVVTILPEAVTITGNGTSTDPYVAI